jgi:hypothetical protein
MVIEAGPISFGRGQELGFGAPCLTSRVQGMLMLYSRLAGGEEAPRACAQ